MVPQGGPAGADVQRGGYSKTVGAIGEGAEPLGDEREGIEECSVGDVGRGDGEAVHECSKDARWLGLWWLYGDCNIRGGRAGGAQGEGQGRGQRTR